MACESFYSTELATVVPAPSVGDNIYPVSRLAWLCNWALSQGYTCEVLPGLVGAYSSLFNYTPDPYTVEPLTTADFDIDGINAYVDIVIEIGEVQPDGTDNFFSAGKWRYTRVGGSLTCELIEPGVYTLPLTLPSDGTLSVGYGVMENNLPDYSYLLRNRTYTRLANMNDPDGWVSCEIPACSIAPAVQAPIIGTGIKVANFTQRINPFGI